MPLIFNAATGGLIMLLSRRKYVIRYNHSTFTFHSALPIIHCIPHQIEQNNLVPS